MRQLLGQRQQRELVVLLRSCLRGAMIAAMEQQLVAILLTNTQCFIVNFLITHDAAVISHESWSQFNMIVDAMQVGRDMVDNTPSA